MAAQTFLLVVGTCAMPSKPSRWDSANRFLVWFNPDHSDASASRLRILRNRTQALEFIEEMSNTKKQLQHPPWPHISNDLKCTFILEQLSWILNICRDEAAYAMAAFPALCSMPIRMALMRLKKSTEWFTARTSEASRSGLLFGFPLIFRIFVENQQK